MRIGIFGGTFNPPHLAHLIIAELSREACALDQVLWIPNASPPHKLGAELASAAHRMAMVTLAVAGNPSFEVSDVEMRRNGTSYTIDTVRELKRKAPTVEYLLLVGSDSLAEFHTWREPESIVREVPLIVYDRPGTPPYVPSVPAERIVRIPVPLLEISGTEVRRRRMAGETIRYLVPDSVEAYIREHNLYVS